MEYTRDGLDINEWVVVGTSNNSRFLGRMQFGVTTARVTESLLGRSVLELFPAFDFLAPIQPQGDGFQRKPLIMPVDFALHPVPIYVRPAFMYLCEQMHETDKNAYKSFVMQALELAQHARLERDGGGEKSGGLQH